MLVRVPRVCEDALGQDVLELRRSFPHVPTIALFVEAESDARWALRLGHAGVAELLACGASVSSPALLNALSRTEVDAVAIRVWRVAKMQLPETLISILKPALRLAHAPTSIPLLAAAARMHERTLRKYCEGSGILSPQWVIGWARLLLASYYLDEPGRTIQSVAGLLRFPSSVALANQVRRYTTHTPTTLRDAGAVNTVARLIERRLTPTGARMLELLLP